MAVRQACAHERARRRPAAGMWLRSGLVSGLMLAGLAVPADQAAPPAEPFALGERLTYDIRWLGLKAGEMVLESFREPAAQGGRLRIVMTARTTPFWDRVYRVRSRIDSFFDPATMSSVRYLERTEEKGELKLQEFLLDPCAGTVHDLSGTKERSFETELRPLLDPLVYIYRMRRELGPGIDRITLNLVGSKSVEATVVELVETTRTKAMGHWKMADVVVPSTDKGSLFSKSGKMTFFLARNDARTPYRLEFDLPFGKLVAVLDTIEERPVVAPSTPPGATRPGPGPPYLEPPPSNRWP